MTMGSRVADALLINTTAAAANSDKRGVELSIVRCVVCARARNERRETGTTVESLQGGGRKSLPKYHSRSDDDVGRKLSRSETREWLAT